MSFFAYRFFLFSFSLLFFSLSIEALPRANDLARYQITELTLKNGMTVCLKQSSLEPKEFGFQMIARGGYASLPSIDLPPAWLATEIAWKSGLDNYSGDELECILDDHLIEMNIRLGSFDRQIEATGPIKELAFCLHLSRLLFTHPQFNDTGFKEALAQARHQLQQKSKISKLMNKEMFTKINLRNWYVLTPFNLLDLTKIELKKVEQIYKKFFFNPAEFTFVLIGDFKPQEIIPLLEESLGSLPAYPITQWIPPIPPPFPEGITKKEFTGITRYKNSNTHITFPLSPQTIDPIAFDLLCIILNQRFLAEKNLQEQAKSEIKISHRFPLFPYNDPVWLVIKFTSSSLEVESISQSILKTLENIKQTGISEQEIKNAYIELKANRCSGSDNAAELSLLANYYQAKWDILQFYSLSDQENQEKQMLKKVLDCYPNLKQYSIISLHP